MKSLLTNMETKDTTKTPAGVAKMDTLPIREAGSPGLSSQDILANQPTKAAGVAKLDTPQQKESSSCAGAPTSAPKKKHRISGAQQRKRQKARLAQVRAETGPHTGQQAGPSRGVATAKPRGEVPQQKNRPGVKFTTGAASRISGSGASQPRPAGKGRPTQHTPSKKRVRSDGSEPSPTIRKRPRDSTNQPTMSYKEAVNKHLRVAIIDWLNPLGKLNETQEGLVKAKLFEALDSSIERGDSVPTFSSWRHSGEILRITCEDESSLTWLERTVKKLPELWKGARLDVVQVDDLPRLTKATIWFPDEKGPTDQIIRRLTAQNTDLEVSKWCIFHDAPDDTAGGRLLVFGISREDVKVLQGRGGRINYGFTSLPVKTKAEESPPDPTEGGTGKSPLTAATVVASTKGTADSNPTAETEEGGHLSDDTP